MRHLLASILVVLFTTTPAFAQKLDTSGVERAMKKVLEFDQLKKSKVGIYAIDVDTNEVVYAMNENDAFNPASNMKLVTAAVALETMGPEHVFITRLAAKGEGSTLDAIYLEGGGDPLLMWEDMLKMASELRARGVDEVNGDLIVDDSAFTNGFIPPGFDQKDEDASYRAAVGAASVNYNAQTVVVRPGLKSGDKARIHLIPPNDHVEIVNEVKTSNGTRASLGKSKSESKGNGTRITVAGSIGLNADTQFVRKRIDNPTLFSGAVMKKALESVGISVGGEVKSGKRPRDAKTLVYHESPSLAYCVFLMNKWSNNFMAEMLFRQVGSGGKAADAGKSPKFVARFLDKAGIGTKGFKSLNGSGLYTGNEISPKQIVDLLDWMVDQPTYPEFAASLAVAGRDGTLARRLAKPITKNVVRGKTGTLNEVTALSGYMRTKSGRTLAYALIINDPPVYAWKLRRVQDELAEALVGL